MQLKKIAAVAALVAGAAPAFATIAYGTQNSGNGELFLSVIDNSARISYTLDLGVFQNAFLANAQAATGYDYSVAVNDAQWTNFLSRVNAANLTWAVMANETTGGTAVGGQRTFTTVTAGQEAQLATWTNQLFSLGTSTTQMGNFFTGLASTGTHGTAFTTNGSSVNAESDPGRGFFGETGGLTPDFNGNATGIFTTTNAVGTSSQFFYVTRSGLDQAGLVQLDRFDNASKVASFSFGQNAQGAYTLSYHLAAAVPEPGTYGLMLAGLAAVGFVARRRKGA
jgi:hypothetical protein